MKLAGLGDTPQHMLSASDMHSACNRKRTVGKYHGAALADLLQVARNRLRHTFAGDVNYRD